MELPIEEINIDISGPYIPTLTGERYAAHFLDSRTSKSDVYLLKTKAELAKALLIYVLYALNQFAGQGFTVKQIKWDNAGENISNTVVQFCNTQRIKSEPFPLYGPERNGAAERIVREHWTRARVLMFSSKLPQELWGEALRHANSLRNRLPSSRLGGDLPIFMRDSRTDVDFTHIPPFGHPGFAFIYHPKSTPRKKLFPRSQFSNFVGVQSDTRSYRVYIPEDKGVKVIRRGDFHQSNDQRLPGVASLLDELSRQSSIEATEGHNATPDAESHLLTLTTSIFEANPSMALPPKTNDIPDTPRNFKEACQSREWSEDKHREYNALIDRETWHYVRRIQGMNVLKHNPSKN